VNNITNVREEKPKKTKKKESPRKESRGVKWKYNRTEKTSSIGEWSYISAFDESSIAM
jgi:hypothetical protein